MGFLTILNNKIFQRIALGLLIGSIVLFLYFKFESAITNNTILRKNNQELQTLNDNLKVNLEQQKLYYEEKLKATEFNTATKEKQVEVQTKIDEYKILPKIKIDDVVIKQSIIKAKEKENTNEVFDDSSVIYFNL